MFFVAKAMTLCSWIFQLSLTSGFKIFKHDSLYFDNDRSIEKTMGWVENINKKDNYKSFSLWKTWIKKPIRRSLWDIDNILKNTYNVILYSILQINLVFFTLILCWNRFSLPEGFLEFLTLAIEESTYKPDESFFFICIGFYSHS